MWTIKTTDTFDRWFASLNDTDRVSVLAALLVLREKGAGFVQTLCRYGQGFPLQQHERAAYSESGRSDKGVFRF